MKLSKDEFALILMDAAHHTSGIRGGYCVEIHDTLAGGTLEIEGYVRADHFADDSKKGWTKFNPNDPKTFPEDDKMVLAYGFPDPDDNRSCAVYFFAWADSAGVFAGQESADPEVHFWRPLPKPPQETEEQK